MSVSSPGSPPKLSVVRDDQEDAHYSAGQVIADKYELLSVIGRGGMGSVWMARNVVLNVDVAIKLVNREVASREASERLLVEARSAAQLRHPSIVRIHDFGSTARGDPFIVMELLKGESLADVLERKAHLPDVNAVQTLLPVAGALAAAHAKGIVHRDMKPENVLLIRDETGTVTPKVVDFGVAKMGRDMPDSPSMPPSVTGNRQARLTQAGHLIGSPTYMAPEQVRGDFDLDERADVWSLSIVLYETIVGAPPFDDDDIERVLISVLADEPTPITSHGVGDDALWAILERGLKKQKEERWQSARDMGYAMAEWLVDQGVDVDIAGTALRKQWLGDFSADPLSDLPPSARGALSSSPRITSPRVSRPPGARKISGPPPQSTPPPALRRQLSSGISVDLDEENLLIEVSKPRRRLGWLIVTMLLIGAVGVLVTLGRMGKLPPPLAGWFETPATTEPPAVEEPAPPPPEPEPELEPTPVPKTEPTPPPEPVPSVAAPAPKPTPKRAKKPKTPASAAPSGELVIPDEPNF
jgi:serine/threonine-protein kinase